MYMDIIRHGGCERFAMHSASLAENNDDLYAVFNLMYNTLLVKPVLIITLCRNKSIACHAHK